MGPNPTLTKSYIAGGAITKYRFVKPGADDDHVVQAAASTDAIIGTSTDLDADANARADAHLAGLAEVEYGGNITRGGLVTSDADGKAVAAAPAAGNKARVGGIAMVSGVNGDISVVLLQPGQITEPA